MPRIGDYALIGDCHTVALVGRDASIDWWCPRRFDAPSVFARILDPAAGHCSIRIDGQRSSSRGYVQDTNVLTTVLSCDDGDVEITDCMPVDQFDPDKPSAVTTRHCILRRVRCLSGHVSVHVESVPRPDYGRASHEGLVATYELSAGDSMWLRIDGDTFDTTTDVDAHDAAHQLNATIAFWREWLSRCSYRGAYEDVVRRSALVCKALIYAPTGAVVAAPTTSLPEWIGGARNWDYRYTWIRDSTVTMIALRVLGYGAEADAFKGWLERAVGVDPARLQIMYGIAGETKLPELELAHLAGHRDSKPVRVGNGAAQQSQHDSYGQLIEAVYLFVRSGGRVSEANAWYIGGLVDVAAQRWRTPDHGIWEVRSQPRRFVHSTLLCWVGLARAVELAEQGHLNGDVARWIAERDACRDYLLETAQRTGWFPQASDAEFDACADAATLLVPAMGFLPPDHAAVRETVERVRADLSEHGLLLRYRAEDGVGGEEGVFLLCSFWLVDVLTHQGRLPEAEELLERLIGLSNDVGLFAEETYASTGEALGNFPQAFTHMALITTCAHVTAAREGRIPPPDVAHDFAASAIDRLIAEGRC